MIGSIITIGGAGGSDKNYSHIQDVPSTLWTVSHNLNKIPSVTILNNSGEEIYADINVINNNTIQILFTMSIAGKAICN